MDKFRFNFVNNILVTVHLSWTEQKQNIICGHMLISIGSDGNEIMNIINFGHVALSSSGEVRYDAIQRKYFNALLAHPFWDLVEEPFISLVELTELQTFFYFPASIPEQRRAKIQKQFFRDRYDFKIAMAHFYLLIENINKLTNVIPEFNSEWVQQKYDALARIVHSVETTYEKSILRATVIRIVPTITSHMISKIIPLTINEVQHILDIRYRAWRECYVHILSKQLFAAISPNFVKYVADGLIYDIDEFMFTNQLIINKIQHKDFIQETHEIIKKIDDQDQAGADAHAQDIFYNERHNYVQYLKQNILYSNVALINLSVHGTTPFSQQPKHSFDDMKFLLFQWMYAFLVLHAHLGVIHADGHCGNLTTSPIKLFIIQIDDLFYKIKNVRGVLIDFSQVIINPYVPHIQQLTSSSPEVLIQEQQKYLEQFLLSLRLKQFNVDIAVNLIRNDFNKAFHMLSILDPILALTSIKDELQKYADTPPETHNLIEKLLLACNTYLDQAIQDTQKISLSEYPIKHILIEHFHELAVDTKPEGVLFNFNAPFNCLLPRISSANLVVIQENITKNEYNINAI